MEPPSTSYPSNEPREGSGTEHIARPPDGLRARTDVVRRVPGPLRMVVVGGIGAGKSTVLERLGYLGAEIIEADRIGHDVLEPWGSAFAAVAERWPQVVDGAVIDRPALAAIVFQDPDELAALEAISHPAIAREIARRSEEAGARPVAVEIPVEADLVGSGWIRVAVVAPREARLDRAVARGMDREDAASRADRQLDDAAWIASADVVIVNNGTVEELVAEVDALWERLNGVDPSASSRESDERQPPADE